MKVPKIFFGFIIATQAIITAAHWLFYLCLSLLFPFFATHSTSTLTALITLSVSFMVLSILDYKFDGLFLRWLYLVSSVWIVLFLYLLLAGTLGVLLLALGLLKIYVAGGIFSIAGLLVLYGIINSRDIRVVKLKISLPNLPAYWKNKTAVLASDLHLGHILREKTAKKIVDKITLLRPDVIFIPGDFFDSGKEDFNSLAKPFETLNAPHGIYFCSGNHELYAGMQECEQAITKVGIKILDNKTVDLQGLQISGIGFEKDILPDIKERLAKLNINKNQPAILLKHVPSQVAEVAEGGFSFMLSGHSHQGQIWPISLVTKKIWKGFDYGLKTLNKLQVYTSSGVGTWGPPIRIFTKSEIVQITFI